LYVHHIYCSFLTICKIVMFKVDEKFFSTYPRGTTKFWRPVTPFF
jgi:hypothetical protein